MISLVVIYRDTPAAFVNDALVLKLAKEAIENNYNKEIDISFLSFLYMPFMHSESSEVQKRAVEMFNQKGLEGAYQFELKHKVII